MIAVQPDLSELTEEQLDDLLDSAKRVQECYRVLEKGGLNIVGEVLKGQGTFYEMEHYPRGDVLDQETRGQYYYHAHRPEAPEHGHFHTFLRVPDGEHDEDQTMHLIAISMDAWGYPVSLFSTNRWVTDEKWHWCEEVIPRLGKFAIDHASPSWPVNIWITHFVRLYRFHIAALLAERDRVIRSTEQPPGEAFENRSLEVLSECKVDINAWQQCLENAVAKRPGTSCPSAIR